MPSLDPTMYANDPAIPEATREVLRRFAPSLIRLGELDEKRYRRAFNDLVACAERDALAELYAALGLRPFRETAKDRVGEGGGALYVAAPPAEVRAALISVYAARGLVPFTRAVPDHTRIPESAHVTNRDWRPAEETTWHPDIVLVLPDLRDATCVGSREWELALPGANELAADLSRTFPVLAVTDTEAFREVSLYRDGRCEACEVSSTIARHLAAARGALPSYAELEATFGLPIGEIPRGELRPWQMANNGFWHDVGSVYDTYAHDFPAPKQLDEVLGFVRERAARPEREAAPARGVAPARGAESADAGGVAVLAIVAKGVFEKAHPGAAPGDTLAFDAYVSKNAALKKLGSDGTLFLVTVRPTDRLWLVARLDRPRFDGARWTAEANRLPVRDITDLIGELTFANGSRLTFRPGKLGMSLQTPRGLAPAAVALLGAPPPS